MRAAFPWFSKKKTKQSAEDSGQRSANKPWKAFLRGAFSGVEKSARVDEAFFTELEESLLASDAGLKFSALFLAGLREELRQKKILDKKHAAIISKDLLKSWLRQGSLEFSKTKVPVIFFIGVNGVGKTSSLAKLAAYLKAKGFYSMLGAGDTFRAAASEQLSFWAERLGLPIVKKPQGSDSAALVYDTLESTLAIKDKKSEEAVIALIDSSGRLQNKVALMEELKKMLGVAKKFEERTEVFKILVVDATLGQNSFEQAKVFHENLGIDGIILTKTDSSSCGGIVFAISHELKLPLLYISFGESLENFSPFDVDSFVEALF